MEVFADVSCPFAHVGLRHFVDARKARGLDAPVLAVRGWPLEAVNGSALTGAALAPKVRALQSQVAPGRFAGFDAARFPTTTLAAMAGEAAARRLGNEVGEAFSLVIRDALFEHGRDVGDPATVNALLADFDIEPVQPRDFNEVTTSYREGQARGVKGSPHFFVGTEDFFCPSLDIDHDDDGYTIAFDIEGFTEFVNLALTA